MSWLDVKHKAIKCKWCGKEFVPTSNRNVFCSRLCASKQHSVDDKEKRKRKKPKSNSEMIVDVTKEAKAKGMSYGQYVALQYMKG